MRLDKFISHAADLSRTHCRRLLKAGAVTVNRHVITNAAHAVRGEDDVRLQGEALRLPVPRYFMLYKPAAYVCATTDSEHATVLDLLAPADAKGLKVAGRLDRDTTGLVLLSDDGQWLHRVTSPKRRCDKVYRAQLAEPVDVDTAERFQQGLWLHGENKITKPASLRVIDDTDVEVTLSEGRYHQVKRMFAAVGNRVESLHRIKIGAIELDPALEPGQYRPLTTEEIASV